MTLVLMAAFADGRNDHPRERAEVTRVAESLSEGSRLNVAALYQDVQLRRASLAGAASALTSPGTKRLAYELCVGVCDADGAQVDAERAFLSSLQTALEFDDAETVSASAFTAQAEALAEAPLAAVSATEPPVLASTMTAEEQDRVIVHYAILNGALELLPDSLASMAIIPLQMKMVYRIGRSYGFELDRSHIKEFLATAGVGMASQYVEQIGVRLAGQLFGRGLLGGLLRGAAGQSVSSGFSFATTYALGRLAVRYYGGGRTISAQVLKDTYESLLGEARALHAQHLPAIQEKARTVNVSQLLQDIRQT
ncbi:MAG TPA: hypothetical protein VK886_14195 [Vicinamibacterales bacterium]|nr:hypothetical protein [Vicinamibacterales bacterium]